jgi:hypothetical protein
MNKEAPVDGNKEVQTDSGKEEKSAEKTSSDYYWNSYAHFGLCYDIYVFNL